MVNRKNIHLSQSELRIVRNILDHVISIGEEQLQKEIKSEFGYFQIKSTKQVNRLIDKIDKVLAEYDDWEDSTSLAPYFQIKKRRK